MNMQTLSSIVGTQTLPDTLQHLTLTGLTLDSRHVKAGNAFVALAGMNQHGLNYVDEAVRRGAALLIIEAGLSVSSVDIPILEIKDLRTHLSWLAANFYNQPCRAMQVMAVTGTNGKTSCCHLMAQAWKIQGHKSGVLGTLGNGIWGQLQPSTHTTADAISLQAELSKMAGAGVTHLAMEASSHGLDQDRMAAVPVQWAVFTNLTRDHLDYHGDMEHYAAAKARLFAWEGLKGAIVNAADPYHGSMLASLHAGVPLLRYGHSVGDDLWFDQVQMGAQGISCQVHGRYGQGVLRTRLLGRFNLDNVLAVVGCLLMQGTSLEQALEVVAELDPVAGRMQTLRIAGCPTVVVDYAHTPDALQQVLQSLREGLQGSLICVVGCGGNRDAGKRPIMGRLASELADVIWLTSDNPRDERPEDILAQMQTALLRPVHTEIDRRQAIHKALAAAHSDSVVLIAGKGHETYQEIAGQRHPFDDMAVARQWLQEGLCN
ncbi:MAG: UDP-N-acetylmuramoyl-L-alanyl-D-glutamate--2,6-diaminopimelate ligase [Pseudomonadales bacterium]|nr:UDP-N-acetylmuramoyl-L-alanyl-D-glutamate--2,6-diaminopimelate ligase [Pseudomonadales bacterium]